jgi:hypothetical protein
MVRFGMLLACRFPEAIRLSALPGREALSLRFRSEML